MIDELVNEAWIDLTKDKDEDEIDILDSEHIKIKSGIENAVRNSPNDQSA